MKFPIKAGLYQSRTSWYPVITASSYKVVVLVMSLKIMQHKIAQTPQKTSPDRVLQYLIALFLVIIMMICRF